jgi:hypothetical protein
VTSQLLVDQSLSSNGSIGCKLDSEEVGDQITLGATSNKKMPMRKTKGKGQTKQKVMEFG